jgi:transcriptional regulator with XRE-family HTH domain
LFYALTVEDFEDALRRTLSKNIRAARKTRHLTQTQLAIYADISLSYMTDIERCKTWVSDKTLLRIAQALDTSPWLLLRPADQDNTAMEGEPAAAPAKAGGISEESREEARALKRSVLKQLNAYINTALAELQGGEK